MISFLLVLIVLISILLSRNFLIAKTIFALLITLITLIWYIANDFTGNGMDDSFLYTITNSISGTPIFDNISYLILSFLSLAIVLIVVYIARKLGRKNTLFDISFIIFTLLFSLISEPSRNIRSLLRDNSTLSMTNSDYIIDKSILNVTSGNYVFIIAESLERSFKNIDGVNYLPNISKINNQIDFSNIGYVRGSGWTIAGHVNFLCGIPLIGTGNSAGKIKTFLPKATCFSDMIASEGYRNIYISGTDLNFAGTKNFLSSHSFSTIIDKTQLKETHTADNELNNWGIDDKVVFDEAFNLFTTESSKNKPFALYVSTINTHSPGYTSYSCDNYINDSYLNSVICADKLISEFIQKIQSTKYYDNTTIILISDHGLMHWETLIGKKTNRSNLFTVFNKKLENEVVNIKGTVLDQLPSALEAVSKNKTALGFGRSIYTENRSLNMLNDMQNNFARSLWAYPSLNNKINYNGNNKIEIGSVKFSLPICIYFNENNDILEFGYEDNFYDRCLNDIKVQSDKNIFISYQCDKKMCSTVYRKNVVKKSTDNNISYLFK